MNSETQNSEKSIKSMRGASVTSLAEIKDSTPEAPHYRFRYKTRGSFSFVAETKMVNGKLEISYPWGPTVRPVDETERKEIETEINAKLMAELTNLGVLGA